MIISLYDELVEYAKSHLCDVIPYNDPEYENKLHDLAHAYAVEEMERMKNYKLLDKHTKQQIIDSDLPF